MVVDDSARQRWTLSLGPDRENLPQIVNNVDSIDMFHYDSDKSYSGREFALSEVRPKLHADSTVIMDDIEDNQFFKNFVTENKVEHYVVRPNRKAVGIIERTW
jgi:hypothetical protein